VCVTSIAYAANGGISSSIDRAKIEDMCLGEEGAE
jgi:hypothetical protein